VDAPSRLSYTEGWGMMLVYKEAEGLWRIRHAGKTISQPFSTEAAAESWADANIDDQMFDAPNWLADPLDYIEDHPQ